MDKERCYWCLRPMGNSIHKRKGNPCHVKCDRLILDRKLKEAMNDG